MQLTITSPTGEPSTIEIDGSMELENLQALLEADFNVPVKNQVLLFRGRELKEPKKTILEHGLKNHDVIILAKRVGVKSTSTNAAGSSASRSSMMRNNGNSNSGSINSPEQFWSQEPEVIRHQIISDANLLRSITLQSPALAEAARIDPQKFAKMVEEIKIGISSRKTEMDLSNADPFDIEAQKKIEEMIRMQNVMQNMETAMEYNPEAFGRVCMLYVKVKVNGVDVKAFVDSGAQATIISPSCAESCGIMRLIDKRFAGIAMGVGTARILGRVHSAPLKIGNAFLPTSFTVLEGKGVDLLFGLDLLKRYQATIDLKDNVLRIADQIVPFLPENEIPEKNQSPMDEAQNATSPTPSSLRAAAAPSPSSTPNSSEKTAFPEDNIKTLMNLGNVSRDQAIQALNMTGGNVDMAASLIFENGI